jgi:hypothetical protein
VKHGLYTDLLRHTPPSDRDELAQQLEDADSDAARLTVLRSYAAQLGAIIGTSRHWCDNWWADAIAIGYGTYAEADTEHEAAVVVLTLLAAHRNIRPGAPTLLISLDNG